MSVANHCERFRPLGGGIVIATHTREHYGTLGMVLTRTGLDRWGLTCAHVLGPQGGAVPDGDVVYQPDTSILANRIGATRGWCADPLLDCAAFEIDPQLPTSADIIGVGTPAGHIAPTVGMAVIKSGRSTGVTEGVIIHIADSRIEIGLRPGFPTAYDLSEGGDSGAIWCEATTRAPVALHTAGSTSGPSMARAVRFDAALATLGLRML